MREPDKYDPKNLRTLIEGFKKPYDTEKSSPVIAKDNKEAKNNIGIKGNKHNKNNKENIDIKDNIDNKPNN